MRSTDRSDGGVDVPNAVAAAVDAVVYAAVATAIAFAGSTVAGFAAGGDWATVKAILFVVGALLLGYGSLRLYLAVPFGTTGRGPASGDGRRPGAGSRSASKSIANRRESRFQRLVERVPPRRWIDLEPRDAPSNTTKVALTGVGVWAVSFCMEAVFGVGV